MITALIITALILTAGIAGGAMTWIFIFSIGEPGKEREYQDGFNTGRIFARYGAWVLDGYTKHQEATQALVDAAEQEILSGPEDAAVRIQKATRARRTIEASRTNWWKPAGMCGTCTSVWMGAISAGIFIAAAGLPVLAGILVPSLSAVAYKLLERALS